MSDTRTPMTRAYDTLYVPVDTADAHRTWDANCGPCALAAVLGVPLTRVRRVFPDFARKPWVNPSTMWTALALAGRQARKGGTQWPIYGLACVQWHGPWLSPGVPIGAAYRYTHWIGVAQTVEYDRVLYDINARAEHDWPGAWVPFMWWEEEVASQIMQRIPRTTGEWSLRWTCEVLSASPPPPSMTP